MLTETGITFAVVTEHVDADDGNGENYGLYSALVTAGPGDNIPLFTATSTGSGTHITTAVFLRLREVSSSMDPMGLMGIFGI